MNQKFTTTIISCLIAFSALGQQIKYVNQNVSGGQHTGQDWPNAFVRLEDALSVAQYGDEIWVAKGIYKPTTDDDRNKSFQWVNGVGLYGGFEGIETAKSARNWDLNETILSGDIGTAGLKTDNSLHVLVGAGLDSNSILDGFTIRQGYSKDFNSDNKGAGLYLTGTYDIHPTKPVISNCRFIANEAYSGGGVAIDGISAAPNTNLIIPVFKNCVFEGNKAVDFGGGILKIGPTGNQDTMSLSDCRFTENWCPFAYGGGVAFIKPGNSNLHLSNCIFERDSAWAGAGFYYSIDGEDSIFTFLQFDSCKFIKNRALDGSGINYFDNQNSTKTSLQFNLINCLFQENWTRGGEGASFAVGSSKQSKINANILNCIFRRNSSWTYRCAYINPYFGSEADIKVNNCIFEHNFRIESPQSDNFPFSVSVGGAGAPNRVHTSITNSVFANNAGGVAVTGGSDNWITTEITNCTFYQNNMVPFVKSWFNTFEYQNAIYYDSMYIRNCVIWEPNSTPEQILYSNDPSFPNYHGFNVDYSMINFSENDLGMVSGFSYAFGHHNFYETEPDFESPENNDFHLKKCAKGINAGNNQTAFASDLTIDLEGSARIRFGTVDMGAYETQDSCAEVSAKEPVAVHGLLLNPNPSFGVLKTECPIIGSGAAVLTVFDQAGKAVYRRLLEGSAVNLDLGWLPSGVYFVQITDKSDIFLGKWLKL